MKESKRRKGTKIIAKELKSTNLLNFKLYPHIKFPQMICLLYYSTFSFLPRKPFQKAAALTAFFPGS